MKKQFKKRAFSLIEMSVVLIIVGVLMAGIFSGKKMIEQGKLQAAQGMTKSSPVSSIPDLALWLETTLDESVTTASGILSDNQQISSWNDISGNKLNATQTGNRRPKYITGGINKLPTVTFDGVDDCISPPLVIGSQIISNVTIFAVYQVVSQLPGWQVLLGSDNGNWSRMVFVGNSPYGGATNGPTPPYIQSIPGFGQPGISKILTYISRSGVTNGSSVSVSGGPDFVYTSTHGSDTNNIVFGGASNSCVYPSNVMISEVIIFNRDLTPAEVQIINRYLSTKYNIILS